MGIDIYCNNKSFFTSYVGWHDIRIVIIKSTFEYIQQKINNDINNSLEQNFEPELNDGILRTLIIDDDYDFIHDITDDSTYIFYMDTMNSLINEINTMSITKEATLGLKMDNTISIITTLSRNLNVMNAFNYFEINGLLALCNQNDCDGYYSPGNSLDICNLLNKIKEFIFKNSIIYEQIYVNKNNLYDLFEESHKTNSKVIIS